MKKEHVKALSKIFLPVKKVEIKQFLKIDRPILFDPALSHMIVVETGDGEKVVNFCSKNYALIPNEELITPLIEKLEENHDLSLRVTHRDHSKFFVDVILNDQHKKLRKDDIFPRMRIYNSYDGSIKYSFGFGFYRLVCSNGLSVPIDKGAETKMKLMHTPQAMGGAAIIQTQKILEKFLGNADIFLKRYDPLLAAKLSWEGALKRVEEVTKNTDYPTKLAENAVKRLEEEKNMGYKLDDFLVYNALNHALFNADTKQKEHKRDKVDLEVVTYLLNS